MKMVELCPGKKKVGPYSVVSRLLSRGRKIYVLGKKQVEA